jgi:hypothetical protein
MTPDAKKPPPKAPSAKVQRQQPQGRREKLLEQKAALTRQISQTARTLAFGSVASCYALLLANKELAGQFVSARPELLLTAVLGTLAIILDAAQYVFGSINVEKALKSEDQLFPTDWSRNARNICFLAKQGFAYAGALLLLMIIASRVV